MSSGESGQARPVLKSIRTLVARAGSRARSGRSTPPPPPTPPPPQPAATPNSVAGRGRLEQPLASAQVVQPFLREPQGVVAAALLHGPLDPRAQASLQAGVERRTLPGRDELLEGAPLDRGQVHDGYPEGTH